MSTIEQNYDEKWALNSHNIGHAFGTANFYDNGASYMSVNIYYETLLNDLKEYFSVQYFNYFGSPMKEDLRDAKIDYYTAKTLEYTRGIFIDDQKDHDEFTAYRKSCAHGLAFFLKDNEHGKFLYYTDILKRIKTDTQTVFVAILIRNATKKEENDPINILDKFRQKEMETMNNIDEEFKHNYKSNIPFISIKDVLTKKYNNIGYSVVSHRCFIEKGKLKDVICENENFFNKDKLTIFTFKILHNDGYTRKRTIKF